jgi:hypothetical protein
VDPIARPVEAPRDGSADCQCWRRPPPWLCPPRCWPATHRTPRRQAAAPQLRPRERPRRALTRLSRASDQTVRSRSVEIVTQIRVGPPPPPLASRSAAQAPSKSPPHHRSDHKNGVTYRVEVEQGLPFNTADVARLVEATLSDQRGWATRHTLVRVDGHADLRIVLATPETADELCAPLDTGGRLSCRNGGDVVLNAWRWQFGAYGYAGDLRAYRRYVVNHETGHALGYPHVGCPGPGRLAPVMLQQTKGLAGCRPNPWPSRVDLVH